MEGMNRIPLKFPSCSGNICSYTQLRTIQLLSFHYHKMAPDWQLLGIQETLRAQSSLNTERGWRQAKKILPPCASTFVAL